MAGWRPKILLDAMTGSVAVALLRAVKFMDRRRGANLAGALMRKIGPLRKEHGFGRDNLRAAFPEKSEAEIEHILAGVWDNLGRIAVEFAHLDEFGVDGLGARTADVITYPSETKSRVEHVIESGRPVIAFAAHLANWELPAVGAKRIGLNSAVLYRPPNIRAIDGAVVRLRRPLMGELIATRLDAPIRLARLLQSGVNVGMLADQHYTKGVEVTFFGRNCMANPLLALLARQTECPIRGMRMVRLPDGNSFWGEVTEEIEPPRAADGRIDVQGTMQAVTSVIEGWVREHPEQWLWVHRRWR